MASAGRILMFPVGDWISGNDYGILDIVYHEGSSYIAKANINSSTTPPPEDTTNWQIHARGFGADALSEIIATDTSGVLGTVGASVISQALIDAISDKVMTKLIPYANIVNNFMATDPNTVLSGPMGKSLKELYDQLNSNLNNKFLLNADSKYLAIKQFPASDSGGTNWINISLSQLGITGKKMPEYCAPMACISWNTGNSFQVTYCHRYDDTTLQVGFNTSSASPFRVTLIFGLIDA